MSLEKINRITITELKTNLWFRFFLCFFIIIFTKIIYGFSNLNEIESLFPLERFIPLIGIALITPILDPELDYSIYQVVKVKETSLIFTYIIRLVISLILYSLFIIWTLYYMDRNGCNIVYNPYFWQDT